MEIKRDNELEDAVERVLRRKVEGGWQPKVHMDERVYERKGMHGSDLIYCPDKVIFRDRVIIYASSLSTIFKYALGHAFEFMLHPESMADSKTYVVDGVTLTPDIVDYDMGGVHIGLGEVKLTWASTKDYDMERKAPQYLTQVKNYCNAVKTNRCRFIMGHVQGDYRDWDFIPDLRCWDVRFAEGEIRDNWNEMIDRKYAIEDALENWTMPDKHWLGFQKECEFCDYRKNGDCKRNV